MTEDLCISLKPEFLFHEASSSHPECPDRLIPLMTAFDEQEWLRELARFQARSATEVDLFRCHAEEMVGEVMGRRGRVGWFDADTYHGERSVDAALLAAGHTIEMGLAIWKRQYRRGFCFVRPPGHHATRESAMGFCLFNNVALAVAAVLSESPQARIAIVDFDLHHGNGTQDLFYDNPNVLFCSSHRFPFYPGTGAVEETGSGGGKGTTVNLPLSAPYGDDVFLPLYGHVIAPVLRSFKPEMIFVSAGFDGHERDPMRGFGLKTSAFGAISELLIQHAERDCGGRILFALEGGYHPLALRDSALEVLGKLRDVPRTWTESWTMGTKPTSVNEIVGPILAAHAAYWPVLRGA